MTNVQIHKSSSNSYFFNVQNIYSLKDDDSGFVLEVDDSNRRFYYYIFKFNGYLCCPAFLAEYFEVHNYACLKVSNGSDYFYIFIDEEDIPSSKLNIDSNLIGGYHFDVPANKNKILVLDYNNKDTVFLKSLDDLKADINPELISYYEIADRKKPFYTSSVDPNYFFISDGLRDSLERMYDKLF